MKMNTNLASICCHCYDRFLDDHEIPAGMYFIYDALDKFKVIKCTPEQRKEMYNEAQRFLILKEEQKPNGEGNPDFYKGSKKLAVIFKAKAMLLENFFAKLDAEGKHLKDII